MTYKAYIITNTIQDINNICFNDSDLVNVLSQHGLTDEQVSKVQLEGYYKDFELVTLTSSTPIEIEYN